MRHSGRNVVGTQLDARYYWVGATIAHCLPVCNSVTAAVWHAKPMSLSMPNTIQARKDLGLYLHLMKETIIDGPSMFQLSLASGARFQASKWNIFYASSSAPTLYQQRQAGITGPLFSRHLGVACTVLLEWIPPCSSAQLHNQSRYKHITPFFQTNFMRSWFVQKDCMTVYKFVTDGLDIINTWPMFVNIG